MSPRLVLLGTGLRHRLVHPALDGLSGPRGRRARGDGHQGPPAAPTTSWCLTAVAWRAPSCRRSQGRDGRDRRRGARFFGPFHRRRIPPVRCARLPAADLLYPKDNTSGCTAESNDFAAAHPPLRAAIGSGSSGSSRDSIKSHLGFKEKLNLSVRAGIGSRRAPVRTVRGDQEQDDVRPAGARDRAQHLSARHSGRAALRMARRQRAGARGADAGRCALARLIAACRRGPHNLQTPRRSHATTQSADKPATILLPADSPAPPAPARARGPGFALSASPGKPASGPSASPGKPASGRALPPGKPASGPSASPGKPASGRALPASPPPG